MSVDGKGTVFPVKLKLEGNHLKKDTRKENFGKYVMYLIETNQQINTMLLRQCLLQGRCGRTRAMWTFKGDVNSALGENSKELSSSTVSAKHQLMMTVINVHIVLPVIIEKNVCELYSNITCPSPTFQSLLRNVLDIKHHTL